MPTDGAGLGHGKPHRLARGISHPEGGSGSGRAFPSSRSPGAIDGDPRGRGPRRHGYVYVSHAGAQETGSHPRGRKPDPLLHPGSHGADGPENPPPHRDEAERRQQDALRSGEAAGRLEPGFGLSQRGLHPDGHPKPGERSGYAPSRGGGDPDLPGQDLPRLQPDRRLPGGDRGSLPSSWRPFPRIRGSRSGSGSSSARTSPPTSGPS